MDMRMDEMEMDMEMGATIPAKQKGTPRQHNSEPLYAGKTFDQWMQVVKNDRQPKTKFDALAAVAELAQGDEQRKKQVFDQIKPLLRKYGTKYSGGVNPFKDSGDGNRLANDLQNSDFTPLFIGMLRKFSDDDLMELAIDEIKHGTANSREFLIWILSPGQMRLNAPEAQAEYFEAIDKYAVEVGGAMLETVKTCGQKSRVAMNARFAEVGQVVSLELKPYQDPLEQYYSNASWKPIDKISAQWKNLLTNAFESEQLTQQGFVAVTMARTFPDRPDLANDLVTLLANESISPDIRTDGLNALEELPLEKIEPVADGLLGIGRQSGPAKERLIAWTKKHFFQPSNQRMSLNLNGSHGVDADVRIGFLLSELDSPSDELLPWLKELDVKAQADPGRAGWGPDMAVENAKKVLTFAIERVKGETPEGRIAVQRDRRKKGFATSRKPMTPFAKPTPKPVALYSGRTFDQWMDVVKNDRQLRTKFDALAAVAELAQGDDDRKKLVMDQIKKLLRQYGSKVDGGSDLFKQEGPLKNTFRNYELTSAFIEILRRFPPDDLMRLALDEIKNGTSESREFLVFLWHPVDMKIRKPKARLTYFQSIAKHSVEAGAAVLETIKTCDAKNRSALFGVIERIDTAIGFDFDPESDPLEQMGWRKNLNSNQNLAYGLVVFDHQGIRIRSADSAGICGHNGGSSLAGPAAVSRKTC